MNILALDIGKYKTVFCDYVCESGEHEFGRVKTASQAILYLIVNSKPENIGNDISCAELYIVDIDRVLGTRRMTDDKCTAK